MNLESATASLLMRTRLEPTQPARPLFTTENFNAWLQLNAAVNKKASEWQVEIDGTLRDTTLTQEGKQKKLSALAENIVKDFAFVAAPLKDVKAAMTRLMHLMLDPITTKPKGDAMVIFMREQELRRTIPKDEAYKAYLLALEADDLETVRAILSAPGAPWITGDIRRRGEEQYAQRTNPKAWAQVQSLDYFKDHVESLVEQVRGWFLALGASEESIQKVLGE